MISDNFLVVAFFLMQLILSFLILMIQHHVWISLFFFKTCLFILQFFHYVLIKFTFVVDFLAQNINFFLCTINLIIWHINSSENIWLLWCLKWKSWLYRFFIWLSYWCQSMLTSIDTSLSFGSKIILLNFLWRLIFLIINMLFYWVWGL